ncbi:MAG: colanic acid biosynthesis acetyltransferase WcaF [Bacteroidetes bacterium]|nr:colanic acid biosynthesis acetyltransferase WcaF [Bacteroidota bacterium]
MSTKTDLGKYTTGDFKEGGSFVKRALWFLFSNLIVKSTLFPFMGIKTFVLRMFGAKIASGVVIKPGVNITYPWRLQLGKHVWLGENVWIENHVMVTIGDNVCLSQDCMLLTGNHNYKKETFDLIVKEIVIEEGVWVGARAVVTQGITLKSHAVLTTGSVATSDLEAYSIYQGVPASKIRDREIG